jgi:hypothetical protein
MSSAGARETRAFASELKFLIPRATGAAIRDWARQHLEADPYGSGEFRDEYLTSTLYFDSPGFDVFHRRASFGRSKFRIRRYGESTDVYLERKLRRPGMLAKRRTLVPMGVIDRLETANCREWPGEWFHRRVLLRQLRPVCQIGYHRVARTGASASGPVRLTLDDALRASPAERLAFANGVNGVRLIEQEMILELKFRVDVPAIFKRLVEEFGLRPQVASKYRLGIAALLPALSQPQGAVVEVKQPLRHTGPRCA